MAATVVAASDRISGDSPEVGCSRRCSDGPRGQGRRRGVRAFAPDAAVTDEGQTFTGTREISAWRHRASSEWTYTTGITGARRDGDDWIVSVRLEGDFPGGVADLDQRFTVREGEIARLVIA